MSQKKINLTIQNIRQIVPDKDFYPCRRKAYQVCARRMPAGIVFANKLEQPTSYKQIIELTNGNPFISLKDFNTYFGRTEQTKIPAHYTSNGTDIVVCGTAGELWLTSINSFIKGYRDNNGETFDLQHLLNDWFLAERPAEENAVLAGIQLPAEYLGVCKTPYGALWANHPDAPGHGAGDIIVVPYSGVYLDTDPTHLYVVNNAVFTRTFDRRVNHWNKNAILDGVLPQKAPNTILLNKLLAEALT